MGLTPETIVFYFLTVLVVAISILTMTTRHIIRSATCLLFVLFDTAGIYFLLGYTFFGSVQIIVYAGGIVVLYVFSVLLANGEGSRAAHLKRSKFLVGFATTIVGAALVFFITLTHKFVPISDPEPVEVSTKTIGHASLSSGKYGYVLPLGAVSILLLTCIVGGLLITRKRQKDAMIHMEYYLVVSTIMIFAGIYGFFTQRNTLAILISVKLMLNATNINFTISSRFFLPGEPKGYLFALFSIVISATETTVAIAIMTNICRNIRSMQVKNLDELKWQAEHTSCSINIV